MKLASVCITMALLAATPAWAVIGDITISNPAPQNASNPAPQNIPDPLGKEHKNADSTPQGTTAKADDSGHDGVWTDKDVADLCNAKWKTDSHAVTMCIEAHQRNIGRPKALGDVQMLNMTQPQTEKK